ncbi:MAG: triose-phosphate isomerase [Clostridiales bacterium]|nr:triose-phosphate isomerase [Clostridiales bacterium]
MPGSNRIKPPFFEIGVKNYIYGDQVLELALAADRASREYGVDVIFTTPYADIRRVAEQTESIFVFAPHMDAEPVGRGLANVLPESVKAAGAQGVMLNHTEKPLTYTVLERTIARARETGLYSIVCADTISEAKAVALLAPDIIVAEPAGLIGTGKGVDTSYMREALDAIGSVNPDVMVLVSAGISNGKDVYNVMSKGCEATGTSSGVALAKDPVKMIDEMVAAVRSGWECWNR